MQSTQDGAKHKTRGNDQDTGLAMVLLSLMVSWLAAWPNLVPLAILLLLLSILCPQVFLPVSRPWFWFAELLGEISSRCVLTVLFFLVVTPVGLLRRLGKADPMQGRKWKVGTDSVFRVREHCWRASDLEKPY